MDDQTAAIPQLEHLLSARSRFTTQAVVALNEFFVEVDNPRRGRLRYPGAFAKITSPDPAATRVGIRRPAPRLGEHTAEVLGEIGVTEAMLAELRHAGVC